MRVIPAKAMNFVPNVPEINAFSVKGIIESPQAANAKKDITTMKLRQILVANIAIIHVNHVMVLQ
jgi:hypothetical protein